jgi:hypothetical protein
MAALVQLLKGAAFLSGGICGGSFERLEDAQHELLDVTGRDAVVRLRELWLSFLDDFDVDRVAIETKFESGAIEGLVDPSEGFGEDAVESVFDGVVAGFDHQFDATTFFVVVASTSRDP